MEGLTTTVKKNDSYQRTPMVTPCMRFKDGSQGSLKNNASAKRKIKTAKKAKGYSSVVHARIKEPQAPITGIGAARRAPVIVDNINMVRKQQASAKKVYEAIYKQEAKDIDKVVRGLSKIIK